MSNLAIIEACLFCRSKGFQVVTFTGYLCQLFMLPNALLFSVFKKNVFATNSVCIRRGTVAMIRNGSSLQIKHHRLRAVQPKLKLMIAELVNKCHMRPGDGGN